jgi:threonine aldolase
MQSLFIPGEDMDLGVPPEEIAQRADSVMFCLSKGLCAPIESMPVGSKDFIEKARRKRKIMGGGMRQAGVIAAAGLLALGPMRERLHEDHSHAKTLAFGLSNIPGVSVDFASVDIDMIFFSITPEPDPACFVCHYWIRDAHIPQILAAVRSAIT